MKNKITMSHGAGGEKTSFLIKNLFYKYFDNPVLREETDSALCRINTKNIAFTTDSFVINPVFFPGGDIGKLSVAGTVNDLSVSFAKPLYLSASFIIEEGFLLSDLEEIVSSMKDEADVSGVMIVTGDTKVVEKGACDKIFITTSGVGVIDEKYLPVSCGKNIAVGDKIIINGNIGTHGMSVTAARNNIEFDKELLSDCASLYELTEAVKELGIIPKFARDATRGGLGTVLAEVSEKCGLCLSIDEKKIPFDERVRGLAGMLGFDPMYVANEGVMLLIADAVSAEKIYFEWLKKETGANASIIGEVISSDRGKAVLNTLSGGSRIISKLSGEQLPRIC